METLPYLPDLTWAFLSAARLLVPGGLLACVVDCYEEDPASHFLQDDLGVPMHRLSESAWASAATEVGLELVEQTRLRAPRASGEPERWQHTHGSLLTLARRPE